jgi:hypothetical protein
MLLEIAKPIALGLCLISLCAVFHAAFLNPSADLPQRVLDAVELMSLAAGICLSSGWIFRESEAKSQPGHSASLTSTLPIQLFCWAAGLIVVMFVASWFLETYGIFYRDVRRF